MNTMEMLEFKKALSKLTAEEIELLKHTYFNNVTLNNKNDHNAFLS